MECTVQMMAVDCNLYAVNPISCKSNPYSSTLGKDPYFYIKNIPVSEFRVLQLPAQYSPDVKLVANSCAAYN